MRHTRNHRCFECTIALTRKNGNLAPRRCGSADDDVKYSIVGDIGEIDDWAETRGKDKICLMRKRAVTVSSQDVQTVRRDAVYIHKVGNSVAIHITRRNRVGIVCRLY